ncbi:hypothetical protein BCR41DRAFT_357242, partial [Lobosporangium transversale]
RKRRRLLAEVTGVGARQFGKNQENLIGNDENTSQNLTKSFGGVVSEEDMSCKSLRAVIHQLQQTATAASGMVGRISDALVDGRWNDAMSALEEMRSRGQVPKLGALQRWVRDCDAASAKSGAFGDPVVLRLLDSILRTVDPSMIPKKVSVDGQEESPVRMHPMWHAFPRVDDNVQKYEAALAKTLFSEEEAEHYRASFRIVSHQKGPLRRTPNLHDFTLYLSKPDTVRLCYRDNPAVQPPVERIDMPHVPGAFLLKDVLTRKECHQMISAAESVGFTPDVPIVGKTSGDGRGAVGINSRWRVYRYVPGAIYRIHVDGQWPGSGLDPVTGKYLYDAYGSKRLSRLTFLVYLNDEFEGGGTTFFTPSADVGFMDARAVSPRAAAGSLLHEGSPVLKGAKYIIRADVLYEIPE